MFVLLLTSNVRTAAAAMEYLYTKKPSFQNCPPQWLFNCINALPAAKYATLAFKRPDHQRTHLAKHSPNFLLGIRPRFSKRNFTHNTVPDDAQERLKAELFFQRHLEHLPEI